MLPSLHCGGSLGSTGNRVGAPETSEKGRGGEVTAPGGDDCQYQGSVPAVTQQPLKQSSRPPALQWPWGQPASAASNLGFGDRAQFSFLCFKSHYVVSTCLNTTGCRLASVKNILHFFCVSFCPDLMAHSCSPRFPPVTNCCRSTENLGLDVSRQHLSAPPTSVSPLDLRARASAPTCSRPSAQKTAVRQSPEEALRAWPGPLDSSWATWVFSFWERAGK